MEPTEIIQTPTLIVKYDALFSNFEIEDIIDIDTFKQNTKQDYLTIIKPNPIGREGDVYSFFIQLISNLTFQDYLNFLAIYFAGKTLDKLINALFLKPFQIAYKKLKEKNNIIDIHKIQITLQDIDLYIYCIHENSIYENIELIYKKLHDVSHYLYNEHGVLPKEVHIPVLFEEENEEKIFRVPLGDEEFITNITKDTYFKLWGIVDRFSESSYVFDIANKSILHDYNFYTEKYYYQFLSD